LFFEKDNIERLPNATQTKLYTDLNALRKANPALCCNADMVKINNSVPQHIFSLLRKKDNSSVIAVFNLSPYHITVVLDDINFRGDFLQFDNNLEITLHQNQELSLNAWEYKIYINK
jgi:hypothetical protein